MTNLNGIQLYDYRIKSHHPHGVCKIDRGELVTHSKRTVTITSFNRKNDLILIMTPEKQDKTSELSKHWYPDLTLARNEVIMKMTYPVNQVKCDKICSNY